MNGYADSPAEVDTSRKLPLCGGWILERTISGLPYRDAMEGYPLFACQDWSQFPLDLKLLENELISLSLVTDPFGQYDSNFLQQCFDVVSFFKKRLTTNLAKSLDIIVSAHNRYYPRKALRNIPAWKDVKVQISSSINGQTFMRL